MTMNIYSTWVDIIVTTGAVPVLLACIIIWISPATLKWLWIVCFLILYAGGLFLKVHDEQSTHDYRARVETEWKNAQKLHRSWWEVREKHAITITAMMKKAVTALATKSLRGAQGDNSRQALLLAAKLGALIVRRDFEEPRPPAFPAPFPTVKQVHGYTDQVQSFSEQRLTFDEETAELYMKNYYPAIKPLLKIARSKGVHLFYARHYCVPFRIPTGKNIMPLTSLKFCADALAGFGLEAK